MYDGCFGLSRRPFAAVPQVDQYFPAASIEAARNTLARCIQRGEGAALVIGPSGSGKSLLCLLLAEQFKQSFQVAMLASLGIGTRRAFFQAVLYELGRPYRGLDESEARLALVDYLTATDNGSRGIVLLVDEAHTLPLRVLEELRLLTNLARDGEPLVRLVVAGGPVLEERFASPRLDSFSQRLTARCYLEALNRSETESYIRSQINSAGGHGEAVFPPETCQRVFQATGGVPRLINQLCDHALLLAYVAGRRFIEPAHVEEAWSDLQQLPTPCRGAEPNEPSSNGVIEFGTLDDSSDIAPTASTPTLRITPTDDDGQVPTTEPLRQIHRIERLLAEADDFQPAGSIVPEIELVFEDAPNPFSEKFAEEEIVADRYSTSQPIMGAASGAFADFSLPTLQSEPLASSATTGSAPIVEADVAVADSDDTAADKYPANEPFWEPKPASPVPAPALATVTTPRRPEYRRLFARLRRG